MRRFHRVPIGRRAWNVTENSDSAVSCARHIWLGNETEKSDISICECLFRLHNHRVSLFSLCSAFVCCLTQATIRIPGPEPPINHLLRKYPFLAIKTRARPSANKLEVLLRRLNKKNDILHVRKIFPRRESRWRTISRRLFAGVLIWQSRCWDASPTIKFYRRLNQQTSPAITTASRSNSKQFKPRITACAESLSWWRKKDPESAYVFVFRTQLCVQKDLQRKKLLTAFR